MESLDRIDWAATGLHTLQIAIAFVLVIPIAWNRERSRKLGLRTISLVSVAACAFCLLARLEFSEDVNAQSRLVEGVITGVGFLGGGAIVKHGISVLGTSTAATIWCTAAIGAAVGYERWGVAIVAALFNFLILVVLHRFEDETPEPDLGDGVE